jgi:hypothetical protein
MKRRCENPKAREYRWYGAKGIKVCEEWQQFEGFLAGMGERTPEGTIHRINSQKGYEPRNCEWLAIQEHSGVRGERVKRVSIGHRRAMRRAKEKRNRARKKARDPVAWKARINGQAARHRARFRIQNILATQAGKLKPPVSCPPEGTPTSPLATKRESVCSLENMPPRRECRRFTSWRPKRGVYGVFILSSDKRAGGN